jgi:glutamate 5-kinase
MVRIDEGASLGLSRRNSLFPVGVKVVDGTFSRGDVVAIGDLKGDVMGAGVSNFDSSDLRQIIGLRTDDIGRRSHIAPNRVMDNDLLAFGERHKRLQIAQ